MSKLIYAKALDNTQTLLALVNLKELNSKKKLDMLNQIEQALEQSQKQEKLLKKLQEKIIKLSSFIESSAILKYEDLLMFYKEIKEQLKELENDK